MRKFSLLTTTLILSILFLPVSASSNCKIFHNVVGYSPTLKGNLIQFSWFQVENSKVSNLGQSSLPNNISHCQKISLNGKFVLPGLIDAHGHVSGLGQQMSRVKLRGIESEVAAVNKVVQFAKQNPNQQWILGRGWNQVLWLDKKFPHKSSLDSTQIQKPIILRRVDGHAAWVNSQALQIAGITASTPDPDGGKIIRDEKGEPTGVLIDKAIFLVEKHLPPLSFLERKSAFDKAFQHLLSLGIVSVHDAGIGEGDYSYYQHASKSHTLPLRIYAMLNGSSDRLKEWLSKGAIETDDHFLSVRSVKLFADGALGSRGAAMKAPYSDAPDEKGLLLTQPNQLDQTVEMILSKGFQVNVHAIGDKGNAVVLNSFANAYKQNIGKQLRNRIEHAQVVSVDDIPMFKTLDLVASMQPVHATSDKNMAGDRIGNDRLKGAYAWQTFLKQGTVVAAGSDFPVELANPFHGIHAAVTRQDHHNLPIDGWLPEQKMTTEQALKSFTIDAAFAAHQEKVLGSIEKGKWADFIVIDRDIFNSDQKNIWQTKVLETWIAGELKYKKYD